MSKLLLEMPYIELRGGTITLDLELENFIKKHDRLGCINFFKAIFDGKPFRDKYGDIVQLSSVKEREDFKKALHKNYQFNKIMQYLDISTHKLFQLPPATFKEYYFENVMTVGGVYGNTSPGDTYAAGDSRVPKVLGKLQRRPAFRKKRKKNREL